MRTRIGGRRVDFSPWTGVACRLIRPRLWAGAHVMGPSGWSRVGVARGLRSLVGVLVGSSVCWFGASSSDAAVWRVQRFKPSKGRLLSVSCPSKRFCMAVGIVIPTESNGGRAAPLAELWDGSRWSELRTVKIRGSRDTELSGVSCSSTTACTAVGFFTKHGNGWPLAERWDGLRWSRQHLAGVVPQAVSCPGARACMAVGSGSAAEGWERWSVLDQATSASAPAAIDGRISAAACTLSGLPRTSVWRFRLTRAALEWDSVAFDADLRK